MRWLPAVFLVAALILDAALPPRYVFGSLLGAAVVMTALFQSAYRVAAMGVLSTALLIGVHWLDGDLSLRIIGVVSTLVVITGVSVLLATARDRAKERLSHVQVVAEAAQLALLRPLPRRLGPVRLAGFYQAADNEALIGGDLYSVRPTRYGVRAIVGDVKGKGIGATETVATVISAFREAAMVSPTLDDVAQRIEAAMALDRADAASGASRTPPEFPDAEEELFATAVLLEFPTGTCDVRVLNRGHPPLIRLGPQGASTLETEYGTPLGLGELMDHSPAPGIFSLTPGEILVAYSDGVAEARNDAGEFYPLRERLDAQFRDGGGVSGGGATHNPHALDPSEVVSFLQGDVAAWTPALNDDVVVVVLQTGADDPAPEPSDAGARAGP
nr:PP2C family protein-serine/threonine phosphatase [Streptomyces sp. HNM0574]